MKKFYCLSVFSILSAVVFISSSFGQTPSQAPALPPDSPQKNSPEPEGVFRINTQLVQIDAVVTDKKNIHVDDLKDSDFEIYIDGKKQNLTYFRLVKLDSQAAPTSPEPVKSGSLKNSSLAIAPPQKLRRENIHRTIALVVDDLGLSFGSIDAVRDGLRKFVNTQMQENDLVAIIQTGKGLGSLQQFTSDKRILNAAIDKLRWSPISRDMLPKFGTQVGEPAKALQESDAEYQERLQKYRENAEQNDNYRETVFSVGTLGAINFVVRGLREMPGRKMVVLFSDGFQISERDKNGLKKISGQVLQNLRRLIDLANRASVVIYSVDARGVGVIMPEAKDDVVGGTQPDDYAKQFQKVQDSREGVSMLAENTGGFEVINTNDLSLGIKRAVQDNQSYYLLGFDPDDEQFSQKYQDKFHAIKIKVNRPGLQVRTRSGYFGVPETAVREIPKTREQQIFNAIFSPFATSDLSIQMTSLFFNTQTGKTFVQSFLHVDPDNLKFTDLPTGEKELILDVATFAFDENGKAVENSAKTHTLKLSKIQYEAALKNGLSFHNDTPIKKPGAYQFKMILRDVNTEKLGSAGQFITIPDLGKNRLSLSGIRLVEKQKENNEGKQPDFALRRFARNANLEYSLLVYNAHPADDTKQPKITVQSEIYRAGKPIFQSRPQTLPMNGQPDLTRIICGGEINLTNLQPGEYLLHIIINDPLVKNKYAQADQWVDFSIQ